MRKPQNDERADDGSGEVDSLVLTTPGLDLLPLLLLRPF